MYRDENKGMNFIFKLFPYIWLGIFALVVSVWIAASVLIYMAGTSISEDGLQKTVEKVWCGDNKDCKVSK